MEVRLDLAVTITAALALSAVLWAFLSPSVSRVIIKLLCRDDARFADAVFHLLSDKRNRPRLKELVDTMYADQLRKRDDAFAALRSEVDANSDRLEALGASVNAHGAEMKEVRALVKDVPNIGPSLEKLGRTLDLMGTKMEELTIGMARVDEWRQIEERRRGQDHDSGLRRRIDDSR